MTPNEIQAINEQVRDWKCITQFEHEPLWKLNNIIVPNLLLDREELEREVEKLKGRRIFPIQKGPTVPWEVMAPHAKQCEANHYQTLERIAERGGLGSGEAWCVVNDIKCPWDKETWDDYERKWKAFAERVNLHYEELDSLRRDKERLDWLQTQRLLIKNPDPHSLTRMYHPGGDGNPLRVAIDSAIFDAAIAQERKEKT